MKERREKGKRGKLISWIDCIHHRLYLPYQSLQAIQHKFNSTSLGTDKVELAKANLSILCINVEVSCLVLFISEHNKHGVTMVVETGTLEDHIHVGEGNSAPVDTVLCSGR